MFFETMRIHDNGTAAAWVRQLRLRYPRLLRESGCWGVHWRPGALHWFDPGGTDGGSRGGLVSDWEQIPAPPGTGIRLCVPGELVRIHHVNIPARNRRTFLVALPYALEDRLLHAPDEYHMVPWPVIPGQSGIPVAVIEHKYLKEWQHMIENCGWRLESVVPEYLAIDSPEPGSWLLDATGAPLLLRRHPGSGAAFDTGFNEQPPGPLLLALEQSSQRPAILHVRIADPDRKQEVVNWISPLSALDVELRIDIVPDPRAPLLARRPGPGTDYEILTGEYRSAVTRGLPMSNYAAVGMLTLTLLLLLAVDGYIDLVKLRMDQGRLHAAIESAYRQAFPDAVNIIDPRYQMEQRLDDLRRSTTAESGQQRGLMTRLEHIAPLLRGDEQQQQLLRLSYDRGGLTLEFSLADFTALKTLQDNLARSAAVTVENATLADGRVHARIRMEGDL